MVNPEAAYFPVQLEFPEMVPGNAFFFRVVLAVPAHLSVAFGREELAPVRGGIDAVCKNDDVGLEKFYLQLQQALGVPFDGFEMRRADGAAFLPVKAK